MECLATAKCCQVVSKYQIEAGLHSTREIVKKGRVAEGSRCLEHERYPLISLSESSKFPDCLNRVFTRFTASAREEDPRDDQDGMVEIVNAPS